ncbi:MAG: prepilin-type N-terminal cleavage/methylation domain-containing protein [Dethiosulfatibacter sp.]|nr:prepilin-type N-terminal cleavage/methylation domain-containing protein [Dethiosulfatibacter sp.]
MNKKGYTLIELILVLAILGIILLISMPTISNINDTYLNNFARQLLYDIRFVKNMNMTEPVKSYNMVLLADGYQVRYANPMPAFHKVVDLRDQYSISFYENSVWFNANGTPRRAQTITIFNNKTGKFREITINVNTGRILLYE